MDPPHHPAGPYGPAYYGQPNIYPPSSHPYYASSSGAPPQPHQPPHLQHGSSSDSSPYDNTPQGKSPPSYQTSYNTDHTHSSSFESQGSSNGGGVPPYVGFNPASHHPGDPTNPYEHHHPPPPPHSYHPHPMIMGPPPPLHGYHPGYAWQPSPPIIEYVNNIKPSDVMSGRGGATNSHSGNRAFRALVKQYQERYLKAKKRDKPDVAVEVVNVIRRKGGRFLRKCEVPGPQGEVLYYDIGDRRAVEKACQALREGAPALKSKRRRGDKDTTTSSDEDGRCTSSGESLEHDQNDESLATSSFDKPTEEENKENSESTASTKQSDNSSGAHEGSGEPGMKQKGPLVIKPCARFLQRDIRPISLDELPTEDRDTYLKEFLPPDPSFQANEEQKPSASLEPHDAKGTDCWQQVVSV